MLVLLDLDGTLTDPFAGMSRSFRHMFMSVGVQPPDEAGLRRLIGPPFNQSLPQLGVPMSRVDEAIIAYRSVYDAGGAMFDAHVYDGIPEALDALLAAGHILALATSKPEIPAAKIVSHFGLASRLAFVGGATADGSRQHKADVIEHVLRTVGVEPAACVMVGDRDVDVLGASSHGIPCLSVRWGYAEPDELERHLPAAIVEHPSALAEAVGRIADATGNGRIVR